MMQCEFISSPSEAGIYDRIIIQEVIKELAQTQQVDKSKMPFKGIAYSKEKRALHLNSGSYFGS
jgi:hypothetical protein